MLSKANTFECYPSDLVHCLPYWHLKAVIIATQSVPS